jgi:predicted RNA-binding Zn-ribbon protein involved in translation (DUF1610 family)
VLRFSLGFHGKLVESFYLGWSPVKSSQRLSEKWYRRGLWLIAVVFAGFLIGLGSSLIEDLPKVDDTFASARANQQQSPEEMALEKRRHDLQRDQKDASERLNQTQLLVNAAVNDYQTAKDGFENWIKNRQATGDAVVNTEIKTRTAHLDALRATQREAETQLEVIQKQQLDVSQSLSQLQEQSAQLQQSLTSAREKERRATELRVFLYRLLLTLPLLGIAGWLFAKHRKSAQWPFIWGYIFFAVFTFFVELVPYLPSYGGYFRSIVGIIATLLLGRYGIKTLNAYMERQRLVETKSNEERRSDINYEDAHKVLARGACPGCERPIDTKDGVTDFCPHCGLGIHDHCHHCGTRKSTFNKHCHVCGTAANPQELPKMAMADSSI